MNDIKEAANQGEIRAMYNYIIRGYFRQGS